MLSLILQYDGTDTLARARAALALPEEEIPEPKETKTPPIGANEKGPADTPGDGKIDQTETSPPLPQGVTATQTSDDPKPPRKVEMRVTTKKATHRQPKGRVVTDSNRCEELATLFEEGQDRFPLPVGNIQGTGAFGCDLLSFAAEEARCQFRNSNVLNFDLVERFIEVKGRSSASGAIELKGNELTAARTHKDRYFIYRIHEDLPATEWKVVIRRQRGTAAGVERCRGTRAFSGVAYPRCWR